MGILKDPEGAAIADQAVQGWMRYIQLATRDLPATAPVEERMAYALAGEELPEWLFDALHVRLVAARGEALVAKATARAAQPARQQVPWLEKVTPDSCGHTDREGCNGHGDF